MTRAEHRGGYRDVARVPEHAARAERQAAVDRVLGVTPADRALMEDRRLPRCFRAKAAVVGLLGLVPALALGGLGVAVAMRGVVGGAILLFVVGVALTAEAVSRGHASAAIGGDCAVVEGPAIAETLMGDRSEHRLYVGLLALRIARSLEHVVARGELVRAYYCPHRLEVLGLVHLDDPGTPPRAWRSEANRELTEHTLDEFRRRFR